MKSFLNTNKYLQYSGFSVGDTVRYKGGLWTIVSIEDNPSFKEAKTPRKFVRLRNRYGYYIEADIDTMFKESAEVVHE